MQRHRIEKLDVSRIRSTLLDPKLGNFHSIFNGRLILHLFFDTAGSLLPLPKQSQTIDVYPE
jgi:hypothetical protein